MMARRATGFPPNVLELVAARCGGACEVMLPGCTYAWNDTQHRRARGMGSTRRASTNQASNALAVCRHCHDLIEAAPARAAKKGWRVAQHQEPTDVPVMWRGRPRLLTADGGFAEFREVAS